MAALRVARTSAAAGVLDPSVVRRWVEQTCAAQGLRVAITDGRVIAQLVTLFGQSAGRREALVAR
jgi:hypothetical protein